MDAEEGEGRRSSIGEVDGRRPSTWERSGGLLESSPEEAHGVFGGQEDGDSENSPDGDVVPSLILAYCGENS